MRSDWDVDTQDKFLLTCPLQVYTCTLRLTNTLKGPVEAEIRVGSSDRYSVSPASLRLRPGESAAVEVRLRVLRFANKQKAVEHGQRDSFHIKVRFPCSLGTATNS